MTSPSIAARCSRELFFLSSYTSVQTFARAVGHGLNADRVECRRPIMAARGRNAAWLAYG